MSPHIGASTTEAQIRIAESIAAQVPRALRGEVVDFPVNMPSVKVLPTSPVRHYTTLVEKIGMFSSQFLDFQPNQLEIKYRGTLAKWDTSLLRLCFLKGFLQASHDQASYVNADQLAESVGLKVIEETDPGFTDYESAFKCIFKLKGKQFTVGGVVFSGPHPRITLINDFYCEIEASGTMLVTTNLDVPGMIGVIGVCLGKHQININQFELGRNVRGGEAMAVISVDQDISKEILDELISNKGITSVRKIVL
jgi:D-3-phosphoglycerate dehydrogenase